MDSVTRRQYPASHFSTEMKTQQLILRVAIIITNSMEVRGNLRWVKLVNETESIYIDLWENIYW